MLGRVGRIPKAVTATCVTLPKLSIWLTARTHDGDIKVHVPFPMTRLALRSLTDYCVHNYHRHHTNDTHHRLRERAAPVFFSCCPSVEHLDGFAVRGSNGAICNQTEKGQARSTRYQPGSWQRPSPTKNEMNQPPLRLNHPNKRSARLEFARRTTTIGLSAFARFV